MTVAARPESRAPTSPGKRRSNGLPSSANAFSGQQWMPCGCTPNTYCAASASSRASGAHGVTVIGK